MDLPLAVTFPMKAFFQGCHNFVWIRRATRSDPVAFLEENRTDEEFPLRIQPGQMQEATTKFSVPLSLRRRVKQDGRAALIINRDPARHESQNHIDIVALPKEKFES